MADEPIQFRRTTNPNPLVIESADGMTVGRLRDGEPAVALAPGNVTKLWIGDGAGNRLLLSSDLVADPLPSLTARYAPLASPALTGTPTTPTPTAIDNSTRIATTAWVTDKIDGIVVTVHVDGDTIGGTGTSIDPFRVIKISGGTY